jgi:hypothetical protein
MLKTNGTLTPKIIRKDCFEKKPAFLIEKRIKRYREAKI